MFQPRIGLPTHSRVTHQTGNGSVAPTPQTSSKRPSLLFNLGIENSSTEYMHSFDISNSGATETQYIDGGGEKCSGTFVATSTLETKGRRCCAALAWLALLYSKRYGPGGNTQEANIWLCHEGRREGGGHNFIIPLRSLWWKFALGYPARVRRP